MNGSSAQQFEGPVGERTCDSYENRGEKEGQEKGSSPPEKDPGIR